MTASDVFFDTNVIVYFASENEAKAEISSSLLRTGGIISVQVLNEFYRVALGKRRLSFGEVRLTLYAVRATCQVVPLTVETHIRGLAIAERYKLNVYDGMIIAAALLAGCRTLYSEDMHDGLVVGDVTVVNPFSKLAP